MPTVKYKPINLNIRDEVQEILSNMCDAGVIEETDEPTHFLSNLLVAKNCSGQLRLLYDCRPSNMAIVNIPSTFTPKSDITYILGNAGLGMSGYHFFLISGYLDILDNDFLWILG